MHAIGGLAQARAEPARARLHGRSAIGGLDPGSNPAIPELVGIGGGGNVETAEPIRTPEPIGQVKQASRYFPPRFAALVSPDQSWQTGHLKS